jgi:DNA modification methylase
VSLLGDFQPVTSIRSNRLLYGDNLTIMQNMPSGCVDLIYLDPPFNSQRSYNLIYKQRTGLPVPEQEEAFCDAWEMDPEKEEMARRMPIVLREYGADESLVAFWNAWINALRNTQPRLLAYLIYMAYRLFEMRRVLKPTGSIYLHCDPTASHYIKVIMDGVFGHRNFRNEITWKRSHAHNDAKQGSKHYGRVTDTILFYTKGDNYTFNRLYTSYDQDYIDRDYRRTDEKGRRYRLSDIRGPGGADRGNPYYEVMGVWRHWAYSKEKMDQMIADGRIIQTRPGAVPQYKRYLDEMPGVPLQNLWTDMPGINNRSKEFLGYPTQKPLSLLERIITVSSNPGDVVFDPFCGCGTTICAAHLGKRRWIGCDIAILSVGIVRDVLLKRYGLKEGEHYEVSGVPLSEEGAQELFEKDPRQFQHWAVELTGGFCSAKHSGDRGIDGRIYFDTDQGLKSMVLSVKGGNLSPAYVRELRGTLEREPDSLLGGFISLRPPTKGMRDEAAQAGRIEYRGRMYDKLQLRAVSDLLAGRLFDTPSRVETMEWEKQRVLPL